VVNIHIKQQTGTADGGISLYELAIIETSAHPDIVMAALREAEELGVFATEYRYDSDTKTFFAKMKPSKDNNLRRVGVLAGVIDQFIEAITKEQAAKQPPDHHANREAHADACYGWQDGEPGAD